jgi:hypothetical protein
MIEESGSRAGSESVPRTKNIRSRNTTRKHVKKPIPSSLLTYQQFFVFLDLFFSEPDFTFPSTESFSLSKSRAKNMETFSGLRIAYLSGVQAEDPLTAKPFNYTITNVQSLEVSTRTTKVWLLALSIL